MHYNYPTTDREAEWIVLHDWALKFRWKHQITAAQFLTFIGSAADDHIRIKLYPSRRYGYGVDTPCTVTYDLFELLKKAKTSIEDNRTTEEFAFVETDGLSAAEDAYEMSREVFRNHNVLDVFFDVSDKTLIIECAMDDISKCDQVHQERVTKLFHMIYGDIGVKITFDYFSH